ncbi:DUF4870 domain-containing protein [Demequina aestuarii]|uniref:DUF4870 domain-containing protein n=1 Tax=Demequina aestuarii TaxID=327095 RepID=UPI00078507F9|nr:DUF4870 domain-containing protein [Demequina aestuarii]
MTDSTTPPPPEQPATGGQPQGQNPYTMATLAHATVFTGFLGPLIFWLIGKDQSPFADEEGKKALNFGILISIAYIISVIPFIGWLIWIAAIIAALVFGIQGAMAANSGKPYKYPFTLPIVK